MQVESPGNYEPAHQAAVRAFAGRDPYSMAAASGAEYDAQSGRFVLRYYRWRYWVEFPGAAIVPAEAEAEVLGLSDQVIILRYLVSALGTPPGGRWVSFMELPGGPLHQAPFRVEAVEPLAQEFGRSPRRFLAAGLALGGTVGSMGDASIILPVLPRLSLAVVLWVADEEFPANANLLFEASAVDYLDTASLYVLGVNTSRRLRRQAHLNF
ncbi:MAG: DUF3786 domain-containing protein [Moorellales bacterium]